MPLALESWIFSGGVIGGDCTIDKRMYSSVWCVIMLGRKIYFDFKYLKKLFCFDYSRKTDSDSSGNTE